MKELQIQPLYESELTKKEYLPVLSAYCLFLIALIKVIFSGFSMLSSLWWIFALISVLLGGVLLVVPKGSFKDYILPAGLGIILFLFFVGLTYSKNGLCVLGNEYLDFLTGKNAKIYLDFPTNGNQGVFYISALGCGFFTLILEELFSRKKQSIAVIVGILCMLGCAAGFFKSDYGIILLIMAVIFTVFSSKYQISNFKGKLSYYLTFIGISGIAVLFILAAVSSVNSGFSTKYISRTIGQDIHQALYDEDTNAMPEGNLRNLTYFKRDSEPSLIISTKKPQKFYLRGMIGEVYTGNAWETLNKDAFVENEDLFYWLHKNDFYGQTSIAAAMKIANKERQYEISITNISACKEHQYLPYNLSDISVLDAEYIGDGTTTALDQETSKYTFFSGSLPQWYETYMYLSQHTDQKAVREYLKLEQSYRDYAYTNHLQLTNSVVGVMERIFGMEKKNRSLAEIMVLVRETLEHNLEYKENVSTPNKNNDFIKYTLEQSRQGYSVHYATAATMMFRYFGVPARYVEGYFLSSEEAKSYAPMEEIPLTEGHAHAWTEIYLDGIGWIPFEVTPGYIDEEELAAAEQVISDGIGEGSGKSYGSSKLTYKPPKQQEDEQKAPDRNSLFRFEIKDVINILLILLCLLFGVVIYRILKRRERLLDFLKEMSTSEPKEAITGLFGYCDMLMQTCHVLSEIPQKIEELNTEARFSNHPMIPEQKEQLEQFTKNTILKCKQQLSPWKKLYYHYILWLYH